MKILLSALLALAATSAAASDINVTAPGNGATVNSPFTMAASSATCGGVPTASMGYSIDSGSAVIEPVSFSATISATSGLHVLHVKCWGKQTSNQALLNVTVGSGSSSASNIAVSSPANGSTVIDPFKLTAGATTCKGSPALSMGYSIDGGATTSEPASFSVSLSPHTGTHILAVKCYGQGTSDQVQLSVDVIPPPTAATPQFSLAAGSYSTKQVVSLSDATAGAAIYYTTDGSSPTTSSAKYAGPVTVASSMVIQALAAESGYTNSGLARASYTVVPPSKATIPSNAIQVDEIQAMPGWRIKYDPGTGGTASGAMSMVSDPTLSGNTAMFDTSYSPYGGVLYSVTYDNDPNAHTFVYDAEVWIEAGSQIGNLEMDNNQALPNGDTIIYAFQCAGNSNSWEYTKNAGTVSSPIVQWVHSSQPCNPATWATNTWHHVQIEYSRDDSGDVTYQSVWVDGVETPINETVMSEFSLGWASGSLVANFQVDGGINGGSSTLYLDDMTLYRW